MPPEQFVCHTRWQVSFLMVVCRRISSFQLDIHLHFTRCVGAVECTSTNGTCYLGKANTLIRED